MTAAHIARWAVKAAPVGSLGTATGGRGNLLDTSDHVVDEAVVTGLFCGEPPVPVRVALDLLNALAGVESDALLHGSLGPQHVLRLDRDVGGGAADATGRLVHQDPRMR